MQIEIANKIRNGRAVGTEYVVTNRDRGNSGIIYRGNEREDAEAFILDHLRKTRTGADWFFVTNHLTGRRILVSVPDDRWNELA